MITLIRQLPIVLLCFYAVFSLYDLLWIQSNNPFQIYGLIFIALFFFVIRILDLIETGFKFHMGDGWLLALILTTGVAVLVQIEIYAPYIESSAKNTHQILVDVWGISVIWLFVGAACATSRIGRSDFIALILLAIAAVAIVRELDGSLVINYAKYRVLFDGDAISHLTIESSLMLLLLVAYAISKNLKPVVGVICLGCIFASGGRTALYAFIGAVAIYELFIRPGKGGGIIVMIATSLLVSAVFFGVVKSNRFDVGSRVVQRALFQEGLNADGSFLSRKELVIEGVRMLPEQALVGKISLISESFGETGGYIHNLLSAWQYYGAASFFLFCILIVVALHRMRQSQSGSSWELGTFGAITLLYTVIGVVIAKYVGFNLLWFCLGYWFYFPGTTDKRRRRRVRRKVRASV